MARYTFGKLHVEPAMKWLMGSARDLSVNMLNTATCDRLTAGGTCGCQRAYGTPERWISGRIGRNCGKQNPSKPTFMVGVAIEYYSVRQTIFPQFKAQNVISDCNYSSHELDACSN
jgi:hypothetical protein